MDGLKNKKLLTGTCVTDEQALWKIDNPSGVYSLNAYYIVESTAAGNKNNPYWRTDYSRNNIRFNLIAPDRFKRKWNNVIYDYGSLNTFSEKRDFNQYINENYGAGSATPCWAGLFTSTEATADGSENARAVFQTFKNSIRGMKQALRSMGVGGKVTFGLKRDGEDEELVDKITLILDDTGDTEGDTFTEKNME